MAQFVSPQQKSVQLIAGDLSSYLSLPLEELVGCFKKYAFYESEYTPMVRSILKTYGFTKSLADKQRVALAMYLASHPLR